MKVFLTGATGFVGKHLLERLVKEKYQIIALTRKKQMARKLRQSRIEVIVGNITKPKIFIDKLNQCDVLIHLAAIRANWGSADEFLKVNSLAIEKFLVPKTHLKHIIIISSVYAMGRLVKLPADENTPLSPTGIYGKSKKELEETTKILSEKYRIPFTILRPTIVYGPDDNKPGMMVQMMQLIRKKSLPIIGDGRNLLHLIYIDDLVEGFIKVIKNGGHNQTYILAGPRPITLFELICLIKKSLGINSPNIFLPKLPIKLLAYTIENLYRVGLFLNIKIFLKEPFLLPIKFYTLIDSWSYDTKKAKSQLNFKARVDYEEGINKTVKWFQSI